MSTAQVQDAPEVKVPKILLRFWEIIQKRLWYLHPSIHLHLTVSAMQAYHLLEINSKPSIKRLEYRNLYAAGRRYLMRHDNKTGFLMMTSEKIWWHPRARTVPSTMLHGTFEAIDEGNCRLTLRSNIRLRYLFDVLPLPTFFTSILVYMWWPVWVLTFLILALYVLSWAGHRLNASLEAHEMRFYIQTILEDYMPAPPAELQGHSHIVMSEDFGEVWDKFVEEMSEKS
jgi:hypothetical protein